MLSLNFVKLKDDDFNTKLSCLLCDLDELSLPLV